MKFAKTLLPVFALLATASNGLAIYYSDFSTNNTTGTGDNLNGQDGWVLNDTPNIQIAHIVDPDESPNPSVIDYWGALGGRFATPDISGNVDLTHSSALPLYHAPTFDVDFSIVESTGTGSALNLDAFGWTLKSATNTDLVRIAFEPNSSSSVNGQRQIIIYAPGAAPVVTGYDVLTGSAYHLSLVLSKGGADGVFSGSITGTGPALNFSGVIPGEGDALLGSFGADWDVTEPAFTADAGTNTMIFDNIAVVPEPSTTLVAVVSLLGLCVRRRR